MAEVIDLRQRGQRARNRRLVAVWAQKMGYEISPDTSLSQLPPGLLLILAQGGQNLKNPIEELVAIVRTGKAVPLESLPAPHLLDVLDASLFVLDQVRFECMVRLGWIHPLPSREMPLGDLISLSLEEMKKLKTQPFLNKGHPHYYRFQEMSFMEKEAFIRRLIPQALELFRRRFQV